MVSFREFKEFMNNSDESILIFKDKEVKYAFEALCEKYSPDHVAYLGVGVKEAAIRKQHRIENAYITILRERGIKVKSK